MNISETVSNLIKPEVEKLGLVLWDVQFEKSGASYYLRIFIDKEGGVGIDDCQELSHAIDPILDEADPIEPSYYMEVSSTGLGRKLKTDEHLKYGIGKEVTVKLYKAKDGIKQFSGVLKSFDTDSITLEINEESKKYLRSEISLIKLNDDIF